MFITRTQNLIILLVFPVLKYVQTTPTKTLYSKVTHVPTAGDINTADFINRLETNLTSYVRMCCKDEQICSNKSLYLGSDVNSWPIATNADISSLMKDIKRSINYQFQLLSNAGMECQDNNRSLSIFSQIQSSIQFEINNRLTTEIEPKLQDQKEEITLLTNTSKEQELVIKQQEQNIKDLKLNFESRIQEFELRSGKLEEEIILLTNKSLQQEREIRDLESTLKNPKPYDCGDLPNGSMSGVYEIFPGGQQGVKTYCEMEIDGGGWTVFQRRMDGSQDFYKGWSDYENGFGDLQREFWLGNSNLHKLTSQGKYELRIDLVNPSNATRYAKYSSFAVGICSDNYKLTATGYSGTAGDSFGSHSGFPFSTKDRENDSDANRHCAAIFKGGWWYHKCHKANLNGLYANTQQGVGINWNTWGGFTYSHKSTSMMIRKMKCN